MTKRRIVLSALVGTVALSAIAISISLAWYGASNRLNINYFDIDIAAATNLKVSLTGEEGSFVTHLGTKDLNNLNDSFLFAPVSSMYKNEWFDDETKDMPVFYDSSNYLTTSSGKPEIKVATEGFFSRKIYLMSNLDYYVSIDPKEDQSFCEYDDNSNFARAQVIYNEYKNKPGFDLNISDIKEKLDNLEKCVRISILVNAENYHKYYIIDPNKEGSEGATFGGRLDNDGDGYFDTYDVPEIVDGNIVHHYYETVYGEVNNRDAIKYNAPVDENKGDELLTSSSDFFGNSFDGVSKDNAHTFDEQGSFDKGVSFAKEESISFEDIKKDGNCLKIPCYRNQPTEIVISVYLEGWDKDCINATMGASFNTKLSFKLLGGIVS